MSAGIEGRVAIVTGGARGIGLTYATALAEQGASVVIADVQESAGSAAAESIIEKGHAARFVHTDVSSSASCNTMVEVAMDTFGSVNILVNNAAIWAGLEFESVEDIEDPEWDRILDINLTGVWRCARAAARMMRPAGRGVIVNQSSIGAFVGGPSLAHYCTTKGGVNALTKALARDLGEAGIRVNALAPGIINTAATKDTVPEELLDMMEMQQCLKRRGTTEDLVGPLLFLAGDASAFMTGQVIVVDGGLVLLG